MRDLKKKIDLFFFKKSINSMASVKKSSIGEYFDLLMDALKLEIDPILILKMYKNYCSSKPDKNTKIKYVVQVVSLKKLYFQEKNDHSQFSIDSMISFNGKCLKPLFIIPRDININEN